MFARFLPVFLLLGSSALGAAELTSGPQIGAKVPEKVVPLLLNGEDVGEEMCLGCKFGNAPSVMIFARRPSKEVEQLAQKIETRYPKIGKDDEEPGACVIYLDSSEATKTAAKALSERAKLKHVLLASIDPKLLKGFELPQEADVTVLLYSKRVVRANHAFRAGEMNEAAVTKILADLPKIWPAK